MTSFDSRAEARAHKVIVSKYIEAIIHELMRRAEAHDDSKFSPEEYVLRDRFIPELRKTEYGSPEYLAVLEKMRPAIDHHHKHNSHHPEHYRRGVAGMNLLDAIEMFADWCAVLEKQGKEIKTARGANMHKLDDQLAAIFENTEAFAEGVRLSDREVAA